MTEFLLWLPVLAIGVASAGPIVYATWWCVRSWSRIWGAPRTEYATFVYRHGARGWGLAMWIIGIGSSLLDIYRKHLGMHQAGALLLVKGAMMFPVSLWLGHWWGRAMALVFGVKNSRPAV